MRWESAFSKEWGLVWYSRSWVVVAGFVEEKRLSVARSDVASMSVFWLVPQFILLGFADGFTMVGLQEYFYGQVPENMRSLGVALYLGSLGVGNFLTTFLIIVLERLMEKGGKNGWFADDLNESRLDYFYWLIAVINAVNLCAYVYAANRYTNKSINASNVDEK